MICLNSKVMFHYSILELISIVQHLLTIKIYVRLYSSMSTCYSCELVPSRIECTRGMYVQKKPSKTMQLGSSHTHGYMCRVIQVFCRDIQLVHSELLYNFNTPLSHVLSRHYTSRVCWFNHQRL